MFALRPGLRPLAARQAPNALLESRPIAPLIRLSPRHSTATFATSRSIPPPKAKRRTGRYVTAGVLAVGAGYLTFTEDGKFFASTTARTGRVVGTLAVCVNEYVHSQRWEARNTR